MIQYRPKPAALASGSPEAWPLFTGMSYSLWARILCTDGLWFKEFWLVDTGTASVPMVSRLTSPSANCNKFYCNLTFYKLNTYLILTSACLVLWSKNVSTDKNFLRNILVTRGDPFVCACPRLRSSRCRQTNVESSSLYFWSPENKLCGEVGWVYPCEDKVSI